MQLCEKKLFTTYIYLFGFSNLLQPLSLTKPPFSLDLPENGSLSSVNIVFFTSFPSYIPPPTGISLFYYSPLIPSVLCYALFLPEWCRVTSWKAVGSCRSMLKIRIAHFLLFHRLILSCIQLTHALCATTENCSRAVDIVTTPPVLNPRTLSLFSPFSYFTKIDETRRARLLSHPPFCYCILGSFIVSRFSQFPLQSFRFELWRMWSVKTNDTVWILWLQLSALWCLICLFYGE